MKGSVALPVSVGPGAPCGLQSTRRDRSEASKRSAEMAGVLNGRNTGRSEVRTETRGPAIEHAYHIDGEAHGVAGATERRRPERPGR